MLYIIGLGLNYDGISKFGLDAVKKCKRVYLDNYTVELPYSVQQLVDVIGKKVILANREKVENLSLVDEASKLDVALLVYGSPLTATTHITLIQEAKKSEVRYKVIYNASILDAVAETGLQLYKFGKIASMPEFEADSFMDMVSQNQKINAHSLILVDIRLEFSVALEKLKKAAEKHKVKLGKVLVCSRLGCQGSRIFYKDIKEIKPESRVKAPYCFIVPGKLHFLESEVL
ncbi:MAG: diphthine synthase, partial [archaeon]